MKIKILLAFLILLLLVGCMTVPKGISENDTEESQCVETKKIATGRYICKVYFSDAVCYVYLSKSYQGGLSCFELSK